MYIYTHTYRHISSYIWYH